MDLSEIKEKLEGILKVKPNDKLVELVSDCVLLCSDVFDSTCVDRIDDSIISSDDKKRLVFEYYRINEIEDPEKRYKELSKFYSEIKSYFNGPVSDELINIGVYTVKKKDWKNICKFKEIGGFFIESVFEAL